MGFRHNWVNQIISYSIIVVFIILIDGILCLNNIDESYISGVGDPGMRRDSLRLAIESWNQCNEVGEEAPQTGSPRRADCFDIYTTSPLNSKGQISCLILTYQIILFE